MRMRIREIRQSKGLKQYELADAAGISRPYIAAIESRHIGKSPSTDTLVAIARVLGVRVGDLFDDARIVSISGAVRLDGRVLLNSGSNLPPVKDFGQVVCPSELPYNDGIIGLLIESDMMLPLYQNGDILFYSRNSVGVMKDALGRISICKDAEGETWVKHVKVGSEPGKYHLISVNPLMNNRFDVQLDWATPIYLAWPSGLVKRV